MSRHAATYIKCDDCGADDRNLDFILGQSVRLDNGNRVDVCWNCKHEGVFACPDCKKIHNATQAHPLMTATGQSCSRRMETDPTP